MKIKEFREFYYAEQRELIRYPKGVIKDDESLEDKYLYSYWITGYLFHYFEEADSSSVDYKSLLKKNANLSGSGTKQDPYHITTQFGSGNFLHSSNFLVGENLDYIKKRFCFQNVYEFAKRHSKKCEMLAGLAYRDYPFLHSVILVDDYVLDFNYDLAMSKDLYFKLFNFEVLNRVDSDYVKENMALINPDSKFLKMGRIAYGDVVFCFEELIEILKEEQRCQSIVQ